MSQGTEVNAVHYRILGSFDLRLHVAFDSSAIPLDLPREGSPRGLSRGATLRNGLSRRLADVRALEVTAAEALSAACGR